MDTNWYFPKLVKVVTPNGTDLECRTYQQTINPPPRAEGEEIPIDRRPSITYLNCILHGASECNLPKEYIEKLKKIPHNGQNASPKLIEKLDMPPPNDD